MPEDVAAQLLGCTYGALAVNIGFSFGGLVGRACLRDPHWPHHLQLRYVDFSLGGELQWTRVVMGAILKYRAWIYSLLLNTTWMMKANSFETLPSCSW